MRGEDNEFNFRLAEFEVHVRFSSVIKKENPSLAFKTEGKDHLVQRCKSMDTETKAHTFRWMKNLG